MYTKTDLTSSSIAAGFSCNLGLLKGVMETGSVIVVVLERVSEMYKHRVYCLNFTKTHRRQALCIRPVEYVEPSSVVLPAEQVALCFHQESEEKQPVL